MEKVTSFKITLQENPTREAIRVFQNLCVSLCLERDYCQISQSGLRGIGWTRHSERNVSFDFTGNKSSEFFFRFVDESKKEPGSTYFVCCLLDRFVSPLLLESPFIFEIDGKEVSQETILKWIQEESPILPEFQWDCLLLQSR